MNHTHTWIFNILASLVLLSGPAFAKNASLEPLSAPVALPATEYVDDTGNLQPVDPKAAKLTILHFWATWCAPCVIELPAVDKLAGAYKDKGVKVVTISLDITADPVKTFFSEHGISHLPPYLDKQMKAFRPLKFKGLPGTVFINENGEIIARIDGPSDWTTPDVTQFIEAQLPR